MSIADEGMTQGVGEAVGARARKRSIVRDGSRRGLRQVASQRGLTKIRMESSDIGWIRWVKGGEKGRRCSHALLLLLTSTGRAEGVDGWRQRSDTLLLWLAAILGRTWRRRTGNREMGSRVRTGY